MDEAQLDTFLAGLREQVRVHGDAGAVSQGTGYKVRMLNAVVWYVSLRLAPDMRRLLTTSGTKQIPGIKFFEKMAHLLDTEGRYLLLNAIANHLRYPNNHTFYYSCVLLKLFKVSESAAVKEQITRVLLERIIVNRPHPWGLLVTFIELIKNPYYAFWEHDFVKCHPDIEKLFVSVDKSCDMGDRQAYQGFLYPLVSLIEGMVGEEADSEG